MIRIIRGKKTMQPWIIGITIRWTAMMNCLNSLCHSLWCIANSKLTFVTIVCGLTASIRWQLAMLPTRLHMKLNFLIWRYIWKNNFCLFALYELGAGLQNIVLICELRMVQKKKITWKHRHVVISRLKQAWTGFVGLGGCVRDSTFVSALTWHNMVFQSPSQMNTLWVTF